MSEDFIHSPSSPTSISNAILSPAAKDADSASHQLKFKLKKIHDDDTTPQTNSECLIDTTVLPTDTEQQYHHPDRFKPPGREGNFEPKRAPKRRLSGAMGGIDLIKKPIMIGRDESYPEELSALIKPLFCELCNTQLNSAKTANIHYQSKVHDKSLNAWLARNYTDKGLEAPTIKRFYKGNDGPLGPNAYHCECCDLKLTSKLHAQQHYNGRKHQSVLSNTCKPSGSGYYNSEGKWVRQSTKSVAGSDRRFGIGESFRHDPPNGESSEKSSEDPPESLTCKVCNISVTSSVDMNHHLEGIKHRKKLKSCAEKSVDIGKVQPLYSLLSSVSEEARSRFDMSMYRTPTGSFYCKTCDISLVHESVLMQHLQGKKHFKKLGLSSKDNSVAK